MSISYHIVLGNMSITSPSKTECIPSEALSSPHSATAGHWAWAPWTQHPPGATEVAKPGPSNSLSHSQQWLRYLRAAGILVGAKQWY